MPMRFESNVGALFQIIDAGAAGFFVIVAQRHAAEANRFAGSGPVHHQHRDAAADQIGHAAQKLNLLGDIEAVKEHHAGRSRRFGVLRRDEIAGQFFAIKRHVDDLDLTSGQRDELMKAIDGFAVGVERAGILRRAETLAHLIIMTGAQIERRRRNRMPRGAEFFGVAAHRVGDLNAGVEPRLVVVVAFAFEQAADPVQLADVDAAERRRAQHVHERRRPAVIAGKVHEVFRRFGHVVIPLNDGFTHPTPARAPQDRRCGRCAAPARRCGACRRRRA